MVSVSDLRLRGPGFDSRPVHSQATTLGKLLTPMCLCHQAVQFGTGQRVVMLCGREGNRRSGVALGIRHTGTDFSGLSTCTYGLTTHGQGKGDKHPTYAQSGMVHFTFAFLKFTDGSAGPVCSFRHQVAANCSALPTANAGQYATSNYKLLLF